MRPNTGTNPQQVQANRLERGNGFFDLTIDCESGIAHSDQRFTAGSARRRGRRSRWCDGRVGFVQREIDGVALGPERSDLGLKVTDRRQRFLALRQATKIGQGRSDCLTEERLGTPDARTFHYGDPRKADGGEATQRAGSTG